MRACVFVDGENFRYSIVKLFDPIFQQHEYLPKQAKWVEFFDWIVDSVVPGAQRIRTYWYAIKSIDCYPYNYDLPDHSREPDETKYQQALNECQRILSFNWKCREELDKLQGADLEKRIKEITVKLKQNEDAIQKRFAGWVFLQDSISQKCKAVEFRRSGALSYDLHSKTMGKEKAVDVRLACDLITLKDIYDTAIIVSGDQDYVPAVEVVKNFGKHVVNVAFLTRSGDLLPGGAKRLKQTTDWSLDIPFDTLAGHLQIGQLPLQQDQLGTEAT